MRSGIIFAASPRKVTLANARAIVRSVPAFVSVVGVLVNPGRDVRRRRARARHGAAVLGRRDAGVLRRLERRPLREGASLQDRRRRTRRRTRKPWPRDYPDADLLFDSRAGALYGGTGTTFTGRWSRHRAAAAHHRERRPDARRTSRLRSPACARSASTRAAASKPNDKKDRREDARVRARRTGSRQRDVTCRSLIHADTSENSAGCSFPRCWWAP